MAMNVELLQRVKQHILDEPLRLEMVEGLKFRAPGTQRRVHCANEEYVPTPACGTIGCIAGWACILGDKTFADAHPGDPCWGTVRERAEELLQIPTSSSRLFRVNWWPEDLFNRYEHAETQQERAEILAERIERYIKTRGRE